ncbi:MAG: hypothetical protein ABL901_11340 [Hyphomicrobiaceae bacterium]
MKQIVVGLLAVIALASPATAGGLGEAAELEHARANARAGGPISERDAELLERHGCLSGTKSAFCKRLSHQRSHESNRRRDRK